MLMTGCRYVTAKLQCKDPRGLKEGKMAKIEPPSLALYQREFALERNSILFVCRACARQRWQRWAMERGFLAGERNYP